MKAQRTDGDGGLIVAGDRIFSIAEAIARTALRVLEDPEAQRVPYAITFPLARVETVNAVWAAIGDGGGVEMDVVPCQENKRQAVALFWRNANCE